VPTVALVQGACFGGGTGLVAACDVVIAAEDAVFSIAEVRWGLTAAIIVPQLNDAVGVRQVRRYALTGERFSAAEARRIGLVHEIVPAADLQTAGARIVEAMLQNGPQAIRETKALTLESAWSHLGEPALTRLIALHADKRQSAEAAEGLASFAEKRAARWR
jgi:methylglutaconyl-CoA hydratase